MSIVTKTGDKGTTSFNGKRIKKSSCQIDTVGNVDEFVSFLGLARTFCHDADVDEECKNIQMELFSVMGDLYLPNEEFKPNIEYIESLIKKHDDEKYYKGFYIPGGVRLSAFYDTCRVICRRAERVLWKAQERQLYTNLLTIAYINRLSDLMWLYARKFGDKEDALEQQRKK